MPDLDAWGIARGYRDFNGAWREPSPRTLEAIAASMEVTTDAPPPAPPLWIVRPGHDVALGGRWELRAEDGGSELVSGTLPPLEPGYYDAFHEDGRGLRLVVTPGTCQLPRGTRTWGWAVQLYALRSRESWGIGEFADLARFGALARREGARVVLASPVHAPVPVEHHQDSPYFPSSRCFTNPMHLRIEDVPGAGFLAGEIEAIASQARALNSDRRINRAAVFRLKLDALTRIFAAVPPDSELDEFVREGGELLERYATHCVLAETYGANWRDWPAAYRDPHSFESRQVPVERRGRHRFHLWLQWLADRQREAAGAAIDVMQDLAVGVDPGGADAWIWQDVLAPDMSVGAPPDEYNTQGQEWGFPPFDPWKLRASRYQPFIDTLRAGFRHAGALRVDHVMGLFRLFWIPSGASPREGTYVRYPADDLLDILAVESHRAGAYVVGEDLGTVDEDMRRQLAERDVLSYRLFWFEPGLPRDFPERSLGALTTHDLPTVAGLWSGADLEAQRERNMSPNDQGDAALRRKVEDATGLQEGAAAGDVASRLHALLAGAPSLVVTATLDDALGVEERPNYPGTTGGTNWSLALPMPLEEIEQHEGALATARVLRDGR